jgi:hypothetical protein
LACCARTSISNPGILVQTEPALVWRNRCDVSHRCEPVAVAEFAVHRAHIRQLVRREWSSVTTGPRRRFLMPRSLRSSPVSDQAGREEVAAGQWCRITTEMEVTHQIPTTRRARDHSSDWMGPDLEGSTRMDASRRPRSIGHCAGEVGHPRSFHCEQATVGFLSLLMESSATLRADMRLSIRTHPQPSEESRRPPYRTRPLDRLNQLGAQPAAPSAPLLA